MLHKFTRFTAIALLFATSCKKNMDAPSNQAGIVFTSSIEGIATRATGTTWDANDAIGVFAKNSGGTVTDANKKYTTTGNGNFTATGDEIINYPADGSDLSFSAHYPYNASTVGNTYTVNVAMQANPAAIDLMYANNTTGYNRNSTTAPNLNFTHQLSKIELIVKAGSDVTSVAGVTADFQDFSTRADFDLNTGVLGAGSAPANIGANMQTSGNDPLATAIILPEVNATGKTILFTLPSGENYALTLPAGTKFESGKKYTYTISLQKRPTVKAVILGTATVTPWTEVPGGNITAPAIDDSIITHNRNLAVVYFIPSDLDTVANWKKRLNDIMLYAQDWFADNMESAGYGRKTFGLVKDPATNGVQIIVIRGQNPKASYPASNAQPLMSEVAAYFAANPGLKTSQHSLILLPAYEYVSTAEGMQPKEGVQPFYGQNHGCIAMDNIYMDMALKGVPNPGERNNFAKWVGGMMHELGHAFEAPHDRQWASQYVKYNANYKMSLMWLSNFDLGLYPCFITDADAAIFNSCEVFNNDSKTYYGAVTSNLSNVNVFYSAATSSIVVSGKFSSTGTVRNILYYNDPNVNNEGTGTNNDYNAITWASKPIGTDSFHISMPIAELQEKANGMTYELKVKLVHDNGIVTETIYGYYFNNGVPVINISTAPRTELSKTGWTATASSEQTGETAASAIDGSAGTWWHSRWSSAPVGTFPYTITVNMAGSKTAAGLSFTQRAISSQSRPVRNFEVQISNDGVNYTSVGAYMASKINGTQYFAFNTPQTFQYFKVIPTASWDGTQFASIAELGLY